MVLSPASPVMFHHVSAECAIQPSEELSKAVQVRCGERPIVQKRYERLGTTVMIVAALPK